VTPASSLAAARLHSGRRRRLIVGLLALAVAAAGLLATVSRGLPTAKAAAGSNKLYAGEILGPGDSLVSPNGQYVLRMQEDGNAVLSASDGTAIWATGTSRHPGADLSVGSGAGNVRGNIAVGLRGKVLWQTHTQSQWAPVWLEVQDDGHLAEYYGVKRCSVDPNCWMHGGYDDPNQYTLESVALWYS